VQTDVRRLIVNADDFGLTSGVTGGILDACRHGIVTSSTVIVNATITPDDVSRARDLGLGLGLHVNMTLGAPLTRGRSLAGADGRFVRDPRRAAATASSRDVEREVQAQIERFLSLTGHAPTHLDSHHHAGTYPPIREAFLAAARALAVPVRAEGAEARLVARAAGLRTPDHFVGGSGPHAYWTPARTRAHLATLRPGVTEFMTHPGVCDAALSYSRYGRQRETEMIGLGRDARAAARALGVVLCDFRAL
jgi:predicted glycoside hydrolase/deacetylase ChbG (UPF0249 family)